MKDDLSGVTGEQVAAIFETVESTFAESRASQGQKRLLKIGGLVTACTAIATAASVALASFGFKVMGPPAEIAAVRGEVQAVRSSVDTLKMDVDSIKIDRARYRQEQDRRLNNIEADIKITKYMSCVLVKKADPNLVPPDCNR